MSVGMFFLVIFISILAVLGIIVVLGYVGGNENRRDVREAKKEMLEARAREKVAVKALRTIANGAGNPTLEAQIALDNIDASYNKELN